VSTPIRPRRPLRPTSLALVALGVLACLTCNYGEVRIVEPAAKGQGTLTLGIQPDPEDTAVARELGWGAGIPAAEVTVSPGNADTATGPPVAVLQTDSAGAANVPDLPDGQYLVEIRRLLTSAEVARLTAGEDVIGFFAKTVVKRGRVTVPTPASRRHSVVISEWSFQDLYAGQGLIWYPYGGFLELANNSDTTVYLDGLVIGLGLAVSDESVWNYCEMFEAWSDDPDGIWTHWFDSLPGTGHTYPLAPGAVAVIATDAIDHSAIVSGGLDLSHADFEFIGESDADNPTVPNSIRLGPEPDRLGHGLILSQTLDAVVFVALPLDTSALPRQMLPRTDRVYFRVPRARIVEAISLLTTYQIPYPLCPRLVNPNFDRYRARLMVDEPWAPGAGLHSVQRKVAYIRADGRKILQHTRTTNADFFWGLRSPGQLP